MQEDREEVEQAMIQADVWRSKFLASRFGYMTIIFVLSILVSEDSEGKFYTHTVPSVWLTLLESM